MAFWDRGQDSIASALKTPEVFANNDFGRVIQTTKVNLALREEHNRFYCAEQVAYFRVRFHVGENTVRAKRGRPIGNFNRSPKVDSLTLCLRVTGELIA